jgi:hypothetical protein
MSRSRPSTRVTSPVKHYFEWKGAKSTKGKLAFYDKEKKQEVLFPNLSFVILDQWSSITGYCKPKNGGIRGTEVRSTKKEKMKVWIGKDKQPYTEGLWADLKGSISGAKFARILYIGIVNSKGGPMEVAKFTVAKSAFGAWMDFLSGTGDYKDNGEVDSRDTTLGFKVAGSIKKEDPQEFYAPVYETFELTPEQMEEANKLDEELQEYFDARDGRNKEQESGSQDSEFNEPEKEEEDDNPFVEQPAAEDFDDLPF